jgi:recombination protein RecR
MELPMRAYPSALARLMEELEKMPGVGPKTAQRLALHLLHTTPEETAALADAIRELKERVRTCSVCFNYAEGDLCDLCADPARDDTLLCVVGDARDLMAMERAGGYRGRYHVLQGHVGPDSLRIAELLERAREGSFTEVILATNPTVEGDATAMYLAGLLKPLGLKVTRIALGLPVGGDLDYADSVTISRSLEGRREL